MGFERVFCVFQSHTYSRTAALYDEFRDALSEPDAAVIADIYAAREENIYGVSAKQLAADIPGGVYAGDFEGICAYLRENVREGDAVLIVGAGDVYKIGYMLTEKK